MAETVSPAERAELERLHAALRLPAPLVVGPRNPDPEYPDEVAIQCPVQPNDMVGPNGRIIRRAGMMNVACATPTSFRPDNYPEFTDAIAALIVASVNALPRLLAALSAAEAKVTALIADSCEDEDHLAALCRLAGVPQEEIDGRGYYVGISGLADLLDKKLRGRAEAAEAELARRREDER